MATALLILLSPDGDPDDVTRALSLTPYQSWHCGEVKSYTKRNGEKIEFDSVHEWSGWKARTPSALSDAPLQVKVYYWINFLNDKELALPPLLALGWRVELNCFSARSDGFDMEPTELAALGNAGVRISVFFSSPKTEHNHP